MADGRVGVHSGLGQSPTISGGCGERLRCGEGGASVRNKYGRAPLNGEFNICRYRDLNYLRLLECVECLCTDIGYGYIQIRIDDLYILRPGEMGLAIVHIGSTYLGSRDCYRP
jgi:hypothetical protein